MRCQGRHTSNAWPLADLCESLAEQIESPHLRLRAWTVAVRPIFHPQQQQSLAVAERAVALAREIDREAADRWPLYSALSEWIAAAAVVAQPSADALRQALAELRALEDPHWPAQRLRWGLEAMRLPNVVVRGGPHQAAEQLLPTRRTVACLETEGQDTAPMMGALIDAELECGHTQAAIQLGERMLEQLAGTCDEYSRLMVRGNLNLAYLALGDTARARPLLQAEWPVALQFNLHALASDGQALLAALEGRPRTAARLAGYADAAYAARGVIRHPVEAAFRERAHALARAELGDTTFERLTAEGRHLRDEEIAGLAFATDDSL
jgi:hypothetical protein